MLMIARCGVTAERQHVDCWSVSSPAAQILPASSKSVSHDFVPLLLVHLCITAYAGNVYERSSGVQCKRYQADCWSVITLAAQNLPASSGVYRMNFVPLLLVHLCTLPALAMLMIARCGVTAETACLTAGL
jgi:hypothetical protein